MKKLAALVLCFGLALPAFAGQTPSKVKVVQQTSWSQFIGNFGFKGAAALLITWAAYKYFGRMVSARAQARLSDSSPLRLQQQQRALSQDEYPSDADSESSDRDVRSDNRNARDYRRGGGVQDRTSEERSAPYCECESCLASRINPEVFNFVTSLPWYPRPVPPIAVSHIREDSEIITVALDSTLNTIFMVTPSTRTLIYVGTIFSEVDGQRLFTYQPELGTIPSYLVLQHLENEARNAETQVAELEPAASTEEIDFVRAVARASSAIDQIAREGVELSYVVQRALSAIEDATNLARQQGTLDHHQHKLAELKSRLLSAINSRRQAS